MGGPGGRFPLDADEPELAPVPAEALLPVLSTLPPRLPRSDGWFLCFWGPLLGRDPPPGRGGPHRFEAEGRPFAGMVISPLLLVRWRSFKYRSDPSRRVEKGGVVVDAVA